MDPRGEFHPLSARAFRPEAIGECLVEFRFPWITRRVPHSLYHQEDYYFIESGLNDADNESALVGDNHDISRWSSWSNSPSNLLPPMQDRAGYLNTYSFGSTHANGSHMAFCDGSVRMISYTIDPETHRRLSNRNDGCVIDGKKL